MIDHNDLLKMRTAFNLEIDTESKVIDALNKNLPAISEIAGDPPSAAKMVGSILFKAMTTYISQTTKHGTSDFDNLQVARALMMKVMFSQMASELIHSGQADKVPALAAACGIETPSDIIAAATAKTVETVEALKGVAANQPTTTKH